jgi:nucleoside-diphosphate-sugar epimerase
VHGDGSQTRCFCHVSDVVRGLKGLVEEPSTAGEIYNVGGTDRISIAELARRVKELTESESEIVFVPYEDVYPRGIEEEMFHRAPSTGKIRAAIGWEPTISLERIVANVAEYQRAQARAAA